MKCAVQALHSVELSIVAPQDLTKHLIGFNRYIRLHAELALSYVGRTKKYGFHLRASDQPEGLCELDSTGQKDYLCVGIRSSKCLQCLLERLPSQVCLV